MILKNDLIINCILILIDILKSLKLLIKFFVCFVEVWIDRSFMFDVNIGKICKKICIL